MTPTRSQSRSIATVKSLVAAEYGIAVAELNAPDNKQPAAMARQIAMALIREFVQPELGWQEIAAAFGRERHFTAQHAAAAVRIRSGRHGKDRWPTWTRLRAKLRRNAA